MLSGFWAGAAMQVGSIVKHEDLNEKIDWPVKFYRKKSSIIQEDGRCVKQAKLWGYIDWESAR